MMQDFLLFSGFYIYLEATAANPGERASIVTPDLPDETSEMCLTFWYHMFGVHIGELIVTSLDSQQMEQLVWNKTGEEGSK